MNNLKIEIEKEQRISQRISKIEKENKKKRRKKYINFKEQKTIVEYLCGLRERDSWFMIPCKYFSITVQLFSWFLILTVFTSHFDFFLAPPSFRRGGGILLFSIFIYLHSVLNNNNNRRKSKTGRENLKYLTQWEVAGNKISLGIAWREFYTIRNEKNFKKENNEDKQTWNFSIEIQNSCPF